MVEAMAEGKLNFLNIGGGIVLLNSKNQILLGIREDGLWGLPGGTKEDSDSTIIEAVLRELCEEAGIKYVEEVRLISIDDSDNNAKGYMNFGVFGRTTEEPKLAAPEEMTDWTWFGKDHLPPPDHIFGPSWVTIQCYLQEKLQIKPPVLKYI